jgi:diketogulonate reductase-like aldo/keto reductase
MAATDHVLSCQGVRTPRIIYGTAWKKMRTQELVRTAIQCGFRGVDTACQPKHYFEAGVGAAVAACLQDGLSRDNLYLQTKFTPLSGQDPLQIPYDPQAPLEQQVAQSFSTSTHNLQSEYVDCLILHSALPDRRQMMQVWGAMEQIHRAGGARQLGISNCYDPETLATLYQSATVKPAVLQNRFYAQTGYDRQLREFCRPRGVIYQSFWTLTANPQLLAHRALTLPAASHGRSAAQVLFRYLTQNGIVPLTGTTSATHMREDLEIFDFELAEDELAAISELLRS